MQIQTESYQHAMTWNLDRVSQRLIHTKGFDPATVAKMERDYRRYLVMLEQNRGIEFPLSEPIDEYGHQHMLDNRDFRSMTDMIFGEDCTINHSPTVNEAERVALLPEYQKTTLVVFADIFGEVADPEMWPVDRCVCKWAADK